MRTSYFWMHGKIPGTGKRPGSILNRNFSGRTKQKSGACKGAHSTFRVRDIGQRFRWPLPGIRCTGGIFCSNGACAFGRSLRFWTIWCLMSRFSAGRPGRRIAKKRFTITATCRNPLQTATGRTASARMKKYGNILAAMWKGFFGKKTGRRRRGRLSARHITAESSSPLAYAAGCVFFIRKTRAVWAKS